MRLSGAQGPRWAANQVRGASSSTARLSQAGFSYCILARTNQVIDSPLVPRGSARLRSILLHNRTWYRMEFEKVVKCNQRRLKVHGATIGGLKTVQAPADRPPYLGP
jgi:hypothetical protein